MKYGFILTGPPDAARLVDMAVEVEAAGWDGVFYWDGIVPGERGHDPWALLAAIAVKTRRVKLGAILVPLPWRKPWLIARSLATVDQLSNGRLILPVGLGAVHPPEVEAGTTIVGEPTDIRERAQLLDEGLAIIRGLASGEPFDYHGKHYRLHGAAVPSYRVPIWVVGAWDSARSMARVLRYDGWLTQGADLNDVKTFSAEHPGFDIVWQGTTPGDDPREAARIVGPLAEAGVTWWIEAMWGTPGGPDALRRRIAQRPPGP
ncbi:MAG TPA: LLM class flavin-dependent oxidoreductase [Candidatus Xenobia bacterium]|jgi:alkanesulfonate monooxygenase SsuD/methylene tetrahydromethanopterin reductase-like flavin-dependent oxidoreductase (luciferase family)